MKKYFPMKLLMLILFLILFFLLFPLAHSAFGQTGVKGLADACVCYTGSCCDGCNYKPSSSTCDFQIKSEYGCPWGNACGSSVGKRTITKLQYCSGFTSQCDGNWGNWTTLNDWAVSSYCSAGQSCSTGSSSCQKDSKCSQSVNPLPTPTPTPSTPAQAPSTPQTEANFLAITILGKNEKESSQWLKTFDLRIGEKVDFIMVVTNNASGIINDVVVKIEIPKEITYTGNLIINGNSSNDNIIAGVNIGSLAPSATKTIIFTGTLAPSISKSEEKDIVSRVSAGNLSNSDSLKINLKASKSAASIGLAIVKFLTGKWYFWIGVGLVFIFLFFIVFRRLFSVTAV